MQVHRLPFAYPGFPHWNNTFAYGGALDGLALSWCHYIFGNLGNLSGTCSGGEVPKA